MTPTYLRDPSTGVAGMYRVRLVITAQDVPMEHRRGHRMIPLTHNLTSRDLDRVAAGLCAQTDPGLFWPEHGNERVGVTKAIALCRQCPARLACLDQAMRFDERDGIWGGLTPSEREKLRREAA